MVIDKKGDSNMKYIGIEALAGLTLKDIKLEGEAVPTTEIRFVTECGREFKMYHEQDCCEDVELEEVIGDLDRLIGTPLLTAEERTQSEEDDWGSCTWTFYELATVKGYVTLRWFGQSNGYYAEGVSVVEVTRRHE